MSDATQLLLAIDRGDARASADLLPLVYEELRRLAHSHMAKERADHTLQATALVHEAYFRLVRDRDIRWDSRGHFFSAAAEAMRRILIDQARGRKALKRGGNHERIDLTTGIIPATSPSDQVEDLLELDEALNKFTTVDPKKAELVKLIYFAGLTFDEAAAAQGISRAMAYRNWLYARAWLKDAISHG